MAVSFIGGGYQSTDCTGSCKSNYHMITMTTALSCVDHKCKNVI